MPQQITCHYFDNTGDAYDATQCCDYIKTGDVLVIVSESVAGIADTWPIAATTEAGALHRLTEGSSAARYLAGSRISPERAAASVEKVREVCAVNGWPLCAAFAA